MFERKITTQDCINHIKNLKSTDEKHDVLTLAVSHMFNAVTADDILHQNKKGEWKYAGKTLHPNQAKLIGQQIEDFRESDLHKILKSDIEYQANHKMFTTSKSEMDMIAGKLLLYALDVIETRLNK